MGEWRIERLDRSHDRDPFQCGRRSIDDFFRLRVTQYEKRCLGRTYVAVRAAERQACGFYTLASSAIAFEILPPSMSRKLPRHPIPVVLIARLAVDKSAQGQGLGEALLMNALGRCLDLADQIGIHAVEVHALDERAKGFYLKYGFVPLIDDGLHLLVPLTTIPEDLRHR